MADPFTSRWDLRLGNYTPYTDDKGGYDPTMPSASYFLPQLDPSDLVMPASSGNDLPQGQSAALLDIATPAITGSAF